MSLVKASILHELDLALNFRRWLQFKREDQYQNATNNYSQKLKLLFKDCLKNSQQERIDSLKPDPDAVAQSKNNLVVIRLGGQKRFTGICITRSSFPNAQVNDRVFLVPLKDDNVSEIDGTRRGVIGIVADVCSDQIRIKLRAPIELEHLEVQQKDATKEEDKEAKEIDKLCEKNHNEDSDDNAQPDDQEGKTSKSDNPSSDSDSEDNERKPPKLESNDEKVDDDTEDKKSVKEEVQIEKKEETSSSEANDSDNENEPSEPQIKPANFGIRMEPPEDETMSDYANGFDNAMRKFEKQSCSNPLHKCLMGYYNNLSDSITPKSRVVNLVDLPRPRYNQAIAIEQSIKRRLSLVEGPAGSGKTLVAAHIACNVARVKDYKVLVCSPMQSTVDMLTELIDRVPSAEVIKLPSEHKLKTNGRMAIQIARHPGRRGRAYRVRRVKPNSASMNDDLQIISDDRDLDRLVDDEIYWESWQKSQTLNHFERNTMHEQAVKQVSRCSLWKRTKIEQKLLSRANIICCTTSQAGSLLLEELSFDMLILDDAHLISEIDCMIALMTKGLKQITLLSDMRRQIRLARVQRSSMQSTTSVAMPPPEPTKTQVNSITEEEIEHQQHQEKPEVNSSVQATDNAPLQETAHGITKLPEKPVPTFSATITERRKAAAKKRAAANRRVENRRSSSAILLDNRSESTSSSMPSSDFGPTVELGGLFERWLTMGLPAVDLRHQFRMHETIASFTNHHFYLNRSKNDSTTNEKLTNELLENLIKDNNPFDWLPKDNCLTAIFRSDSIKINEKLNQILDHLLAHENIQNSRVGVIFNRHQDSFADKWQSNSSKYNNMIKIGTIDKFIGQEMDFVILVAGCCEPDKSSQLARLALCSQLERNFMIDDCTLNLALTRARLGLFIITDYDNTNVGQQQNGAPSTSTAADKASQAETSSCFSWRKLMDYYGMNKLIS